jgi:ribonuclease D
VTSAAVQVHDQPLHLPEQISALAAELARESIIAFDTEFIRESTFYPVVEVIQVATAKKSWLVDAQAFRGSAEKKKGLEPLLEIFRNKSILKIVHAAQGDQECLFTAFGTIATPSLDTAVAASFCGYGDGVGLGNLLKSLLGVNLKKGHARTNWGVRPLPAQLLEYAHLDVIHLVEAGEKLLTELDKLGRRAWAMELTARFEDSSLYEPEPDLLTAKLARGGKVDAKGFAVLRELMRWREGRVRQLNLPRRWVADDQVLMDLAQVRPKDAAHLGAFRGLGKGEIKHSSEQILAAIRLGLEQASQVEMPERNRSEIPSDDEKRVIDLLQCYVGILADQHQIAVKHVATSGQLLPLLRARERTVEEWVTEGLLSEGAARLMGPEIRDFLMGRRALSVSGRRVKVVSVAESPRET